MKSSYIHVTNLLEESLTQAVQEFVNLYAHEEKKELLTCSIFKHKKEDLFIVANLDSYDLFLVSYLTNFIKYPIETHLLGAEAEINGYVNVSEMNRTVPFSEAEKIQIFNTGTIEEPDAVILTTDQNENYFLDFGDRISVCDAELPSFKKLEFIPADYEKLCDVIPVVKERPVKPWWRFW